MSVNLPGLNTAWLGRSFYYFDTLDSTNAYLKNRASELDHGTAVIAGRQTSGRGRFGRVWQDSGSGLALSFLLRTGNLNGLSCLPLVAGLSVSLALSRLTGEHFGLKWSNDVLFDGKKLCGILCESRLAVGDASLSSIVVGIGVNLNQSRAALDRLGLVYATSLELATGGNPGGLAVAAEICNQFEPLFEKFRKSGFTDLKEIYKQNCVTLGRQVRVISGRSERTGLCIDIAEDGGLVCDIDGETALIHAGEASVRGLYGYV